MRNYESYSPNVIGLSKMYELNIILIYNNNINNFISETQDTI